MFYNGSRRKLLMEYTLREDRVIRIEVVATSGIYSNLCCAVNISTPDWYTHGSVDFAGTRLWS